MWDNIKEALYITLTISTIICNVIAIVKGLKK